MNASTIPNNASGYLKRRQRGLSIIELMVGITIGLIVVAGATTMVVNQINEHRHLMLETQVQQDLRAAADLMMRDLRRAGFWEQAQNGIWYPGGPANPASNPYSAIQSTGNSINYSITQAERATYAENNQLDPNENYGFSVSNGVLYYELAGAAPQPLTDPNSLLIENDGFQVTEVLQTVDLSSFCVPACVASATVQCPTQQIRFFTISISGQATSDPNVKRNVVVSARVRNDNFTGTPGCPS